MRSASRHDPVAACASRGASGGGTPTAVLFVHTATLPPLGADTWVHAQIMRSLDQDAFEVHAACAFGPAGRPSPTYAVLRDIPGLRLRRIDFGRERYDLGLRGRLRTLLGTVPAALDFVGLARYIRRHRIGIIHTSDRPRDALACVLVARLTGAKSIVQVHVAYGEWMSPLLRWALRHADALIGVSAFVADTLIASGHDPARTYVARNAIDTRQWAPRRGRDDARRELAVPDDAPLVLTVCRLFPEKGPAELVRALALVSADHPDARLAIVGTEMRPGFVAELRALVDDLGLGDRVVLAGRRADVERLMAAADIFAMPSLEEPFGLVYLEAMAMELPVVALRSGGAVEVVDDGVTGLLSDVGDTVALAANLGALMNDGERRTLLGKRGRTRAEESFTLGRQARDVETVYRAIAPARRTKDRKRGRTWAR